MLLPNDMRLLNATLLSRDGETKSWVVRVRIGEPAWEWQKIMIATELDVDAASRPLARRFGATLATWMQAINHPHIVQVFSVEGGETPVALSEWEACHTLEAVCGALPGSVLTMPVEMADPIADAIEDALRTLHAAGLAHGHVGPEQVLVTPEGAVKLALGAPWREDASVEDDLRRAAALRVSLRELARGELGDRSPGDVGALAAAACGVPPDPFAD